MKTNTARSSNTIRTGKSAAVVALVLLLTVANALAVGRNPNPWVLPAGSTPYGRTFGDWAAEWWAWALQFPLEQSPLIDPTGTFCSAGQQGPVWFLTGNFEGSVERTLTIPAGKAILFPLFNVFNAHPSADPNFRPVPDKTLEQYLQEGAEAIIEMATELFAEVDGMPIQNLWNYRSHSDLVIFIGHPSLAALDPYITGELQSGVAAGYWVMLTPLSKGQHTIRFGAIARYGDFEFEAAVTYRVTVR